MATGKRGSWIAFEKTRGSGTRRQVVQFNHGARPRSKSTFRLEATPFAYRQDTMQLLLGRVDLNSLLPSKSHLMRRDVTVVGGLVA